MQLGAWLGGFLSAYNYFVPGVSDITGGTDFAGLEAWIDNYCSQNPLDSLNVAAVALVTLLKTR